jgi:hypothetical protein
MRDELPSEKPAAGFNRSKGGLQMGIVVRETVTKVLPKKADKDMMKDDKGMTKDERAMMKEQKGTMKEGKDAKMKDKMKTEKTGKANMGER